MELPGVRGFLSEVAQACEAMGMLVLNASLSIGRGCAAATVGRRNLWIDALGYDSKGVEMFANCPTSGNQTLCGCTNENLEKMKKEQTDRETVAKAMAGCKKPVPTPASSTPGTGRGRGGYAQANSVKLQKVWSEGIPGAGRGRGRGRYQGQKKKQQPQTQQAATGQPSGTESPAAKKTKK